MTLRRNNFWQDQVILALVILFSLLLCDAIIHTHRPEDIPQWFLDERLSPLYALVTNMTFLSVLFYLFLVVCFLGFIVAMVFFGLDRMKAAKKRLAIHDDYKEKRLHVRLYEEHRQFVDKTERKTKELAAIAEPVFEDEKAGGWKQ